MSAVERVFLREEDISKTYCTICSVKIQVINNLKNTLMSLIILMQG